MSTQTQTENQTVAASSSTPPPVPPTSPQPISTLSIAGYPSGEFKYFWDDVTRDANTGLPIKGSLGTGFHVHENLMTRFEQCGKTWEGLNTYLSKNIWVESVVKGQETVVKNRKPPKNKQGHYISSVKVREIDDFLSFAGGIQPYFYLRKGKELIGLCKKTSNYIYDYDPARPRHLPHRINFDFVRPPTDQEREDFMMGPGKSGIPKVIEHQPLRHVDESQVRKAAEEEARKLAEEEASKAQEAITAEISTLQDTYTANKTKIKEINEQIRELMNQQKVLVNANLETRERLHALKAPVV